MSKMSSQITSVSIVCSIIYAGADQTKHQSFASPAFVRGIYRWPVNSPKKGPVTRKMFLFDDVIMAEMETIVEPYCLYAQVMKSKENIMLFNYFGEKITNHRLVTAIDDDMLFKRNILSLVNTNYAN